MNRYARGPRTVHRDHTNPAPEAAFTKQVLEVADWHRWPLRYHVMRSDRAGITGEGCDGFPDWILARPGRVVALELKSVNGKPTPEQLAWAAAMDGARVDAMVAWPRDLAVIQGLLTP